MVGEGTLTVLCLNGPPWDSMTPLISRAPYDNADEGRDSQF